MDPQREQRIAIDTHHTDVYAACSQRGKPKRKLRYMQKDGRCPVEFKTIPGEWGGYVTDIFTTLVEIRWRVMFLIFSLSNILSWLLFGLLYWLTAYVHNDTEDSGNQPCMYNVRSFTASFLFSMETQATIGYGFRGMTENCLVVIILGTVQVVSSCFIDTAIIGIIVAKMASARKRAQTVGFSKCAVVNLRDGVLCLSWRLGDFRRNHILEGTTRAQLVRHVKHSSGMFSVYHKDLDIKGRDVVLATPATLVHRLEPGSPLYSMGPDSLLEEDFELVLSFTYTGDSTGILHQTRTTYTPADIHWGQRFQDMLRLGVRHYTVDYALFNQTTWVQVPMVSAEECDREKLPNETIRAQGSLLRNPSEIGQSNADVTEEVIQEAWL
ncbi:inward rectifier potassium channel 16-like [Osmerus mordax]|uniref:inward rectifier potassium channel 16-like n=1 Tax=Osmerus mordax TaxID=8014 RepID=UPI00350FEEA5